MVGKGKPNAQTPSPKTGDGVCKEAYSGGDSVHVDLATQTVGQCLPLGVFQTRFKRHRVVSGGHTEDQHARVAAGFPVARDRSVDAGDMDQLIGGLDACHGLREQQDDCRFAGRGAGVDQPELFRFDLAAGSPPGCRSRNVDLRYGDVMPGLRFAFSRCGEMCATRSGVRRFGLRGSRFR